MPLRNTIKEDRLLSNVSRAYRNEEYIANKIFPIVSVKRTSDLYRIYTKNWKLPETRRDASGLAREWDFQVTTGTYSLVLHGMKDYISKDDMDNYEHSNLKVDTTEELTDVLNRRQEYDAAALFTTTNWSQNVSLTAATTWTLQTTASNPIIFVDTGTSVIMQNAGVSPNYMILPRNSFISAKNHVSILDRVKYTSADMTPQILKGLFGISGEVLVPNASYDTAAEGIAESASPFFDDFCFLGYKPPRASMKKPSAGYMFEKVVPRVRTWIDKERFDSEVIEVSSQYQFKVISPLAGYLINNTN